MRKKRKGAEELTVGSLAWSYRYRYGGGEEYSLSRSIAKGKTFELFVAKDYTAGVWELLWRISRKDRQGTKIETTSEYITLTDEEVVDAIQELMQDMGFGRIRIRNTKED